MGATGFQRIVIGLTATVLLAVSLKRIVVADEAQMLAYRESRAETTLIPTDGSASGYRLASDGSLNFVTGRNPDGKLRLVLFVLHTSRLPQDVQYWNLVAAEVGRYAQASGAAYGFWGICESPATCAPAATGAHFSVIEYLDPYQMRATALADTDRNALIYRAPRVPVLRLSEKANPNEVAQAIAHLAPQ